MSYFEISIENEKFSSVFQIILLSGLIGSFFSCKPLMALIHSFHCSPRFSLILSSICLLIICLPRIDFPYSPYATFLSLFAQTFSNSLGMGENSCHKLKLYPKKFWIHEQRKKKSRSMLQAVANKNTIRGLKASLLITAKKLKNFSFWV